MGFEEVVSIAMDLGHDKRNAEDIAEELGRRRERVEGKRVTLTSAGRAMLGEVTAKVHLINEHRIAVPSDMSVYIATHTHPGDWDEIHYRGQSLYTFECGDHNADGIYTGPFGICTDEGESFEFNSLTSARAFIDNAAESQADAQVAAEIRHERNQLGS